MSILDTIKFSIICATYNAGSTLKNTLDSVLQQSYHSHLIEMVVVDGLSDDDTLDILQEYRSKFNGRLVYISEKDNGIYHAFNKGIAMASGNFINFQGSGDRLHYTALEKVAELIKNDSKVQAVQGFVALEYCNQNKQTALWDDLQAMRDDKTIRCHHQAFFYRKDLHLLVGNYNEEYRLASDYDFALKIVASASKISNIKEILAYFLAGGASFTNKRLLDDEIARSRSEIIGEHYHKQNIFLSRLLKLIKICLPYGLVKWLRIDW